MLWLDGIHVSHPESGGQGWHMHTAPGPVVSLRGSCVPQIGGYGALLSADEPRPASVTPTMARCPEKGDLTDQAFWLRIATGQSILFVLDTSPSAFQRSQGRESRLPARLPGPRIPHLQTGDDSGLWRVGPLRTRGRGWFSPLRVAPASRWGRGAQALSPTC